MKHALWLAPLIAGSIGTPSFAETVPSTTTWQSSAKFSTGAKFLSGLGEDATLAGATAAFFLTDNLYWGLGGYGGKTGRNPLAGSAIGYGGVLVGAEVPLSAGWSVDHGCLIGGSMGRAIGPTFEPVVTIDRDLGRGLLAGVGLSGLYTMAQTETIGATVGLHLRFKTLMSGL